MKSTRSIHDWKDFARPMQQDCSFTQNCLQRTKISQNQSMLPLTRKQTVESSINRNSSEDCHFLSRSMIQMPLKRGSTKTANLAIIEESKSAYQVPRGQFGDIRY